MRSTNADEPVLPAQEGDVYTGVTYREHVAVEAMNAILGGGMEDRHLLFWGNTGLEWNHANLPSMVARLAFQMASAMVAEGKKGEGK